MSFLPHVLPSQGFNFVFHRFRNNLVRLRSAQYISETNLHIILRRFGSTSLTILVQTWSVLHCTEQKTHHSCLKLNWQVYLQGQQVDILNGQKQNEIKAKKKKKQLRTNPLSQMTKCRFYSCRTRSPSNSLHQGPTRFGCVDHFSKDNDMYKDKRKGKHDRI